MDYRAGNYRHAILDINAGAVIQDLRMSMQGVEYVMQRSGDQYAIPAAYSPNYPGLEVVLGTASDGLGR